MPSKTSNANANNINFIIIDMSYFIFYRYYAIKSWWQHAKPEVPLNDEIDYNIEFMEKFEKTFLQKFKEIPKKLKIDKQRYEFVIAKDCRRGDIWRNDLFKKYKENREKDDKVMLGPFFERAYQLLEKENYNILYHEKLEGDDCAALITKILKAENKDDINIYIIANDMDYLQLIDDNVKIINLKYKSLSDSSKWSGEPKKDLFCKIVMGDKSDDIPGIFAKCGIKTALKCYEDDKLFKEKLEKEQATERYNLNKKIIDFDEIPDIYKGEFYINNQQIIHNLKIGINLMRTISSAY